MQSIMYKKITFLLFLILPAFSSAQTIIDLKPGGSVRAKTIEDYKAEQKMKEREEADSLQYADNLLRAFNALHTDSLAEAERLFEESLRLRPHAPGNYIIRHNLALIDLARGQYMRAEKKLTELIQTVPNYYDARLTRAKTYLQLDRAREAIQDAETLLNTDELKYQSHDYLRQARFVRASARYRLRQYPDARADLRRILEEDPQNLNAAVLEALTLHQLGQTQEALNRLNLLLTRDPKSIDVLLARAELHTSLKQYALARADYDQLIELHPNDPTLRTDRARTLINLGEKSAARRDLDRAIELGLPRGSVQSLYNLTRTK